MSHNEPPSSSNSPPPGDIAADTEPAPPPPPSSPGRLVRYPERGPVAGVSEGLGLHFGVDPVVMRIAFVALTILAFPLGLVLYAICWIAIPAVDSEAAQHPPGAAQPISQQRTRTWLGITLLIIGGVWLIGQLAALPAAGLFGFDALATALTSGSVLALLLVGGGAALLLLDRSGSREPGERPASTPPAAAAAAAASADDTAPSSQAAVETPERAPAPPRSRLGRVSAGVVLIVLGVMWWLDQVGAIAVGVREALAMALLVVGGGLVVGAWWGRSRGLIAWGVALAVLVVIANLPVAAGWQDLRAVAAGGMGERTWQPTTVDEIAPRYELGMGNATLDLSNVDFDGAAVDLSASVGMGELTVYVPDDVDVDIDGSVRMGEIRLFDATAGGVGQLERTATDTVADPNGALDLTVAVGMGELGVERR